MLFDALKRFGAAIAVEVLSVIVAIVVFVASGWKPALLVIAGGLAVSLILVVLAGRKTFQFGKGIIDDLEGELPSGGRLFPSDPFQSVDDVDKETGRGRTPDGTSVPRHLRRRD